MENKSLILMNLILSNIKNLDQTFYEEYEILKQQSSENLEQSIINQLLYQIFSKIQENQEDSVIAIYYLEQVMGSHFLSVSCQVSETQLISLFLKCNADLNLWGEILDGSYQQLMLGACGMIQLLSCSAADLIEEQIQNHQKKRV